MREKERAYVQEEIRKKDILYFKSKLDTEEKKTMETTEKVGST